MGMIMFFVLRAGRRNPWEEVTVEAEVCRNQKRSPRKQSVVTERTEEIFFAMESNCDFLQPEKKMLILNFFLLGSYGAFL